MHGAEWIVVTELRQAFEGRPAVLDVDELEAERLRDRRSRIGPVDQLLQEGEPVGRERLILRRDAVFPHHLVHAALPLFVAESIIPKSMSSTPIGTGFRKRSCSHE